MTGSDVPLEILLHFISGLPREYTDYGGMVKLFVLCIYLHLIMLRTG